jgi:hypothetical protein
LTITLDVEPVALYPTEPLTVTARVYDRGTAVTDAGAWAKIDGPSGSATVPLIPNGEGRYVLCFRPEDLKVSLEGPVLPGTWRIQAVADYWGGEATMEKTFVVQSMHPLYLPIVSGDR